MNTTIKEIVQTVAPQMAEYCGTCKPFFNAMKSCPRPEPFASGDIVQILLEILWVTASVHQYLIYTVLVLSFFVQRTSRNFFFTTNLLIQELLCDRLKGVYMQARPEGACTTTYGAPSCHSSFSSAILTWLVLEIIAFDSNVAFKQTRQYKILRIAAFLFVPIIPISRNKLNYHTVSQIVYGIIEGIIVSVIYFSLIYKAFITKSGGKSYGPGFTRFWEKCRFHDNFISIHHKLNGSDKDSKDKKDK